MRRPRLRRPRLPRTRKGQRRLVRVVVAGCVLALLPSAWLRVVTDDRLRTVADVPRTEVAVVFGAGLWDGEPSPYLAHRLDAAAELYRAGRIAVVLVTGDNSREEYDEPDAMRAYLVRHGVPDGRIVSDYAGFDTWDSCVRAKKIFGVDRAVLISQGFHIRRAVALCQEAGVASYGVGVADEHDVTWYYGAPGRSSRRARRRWTRSSSRTRTSSARGNRGGAGPGRRRMTRPSPRPGGGGEVAVPAV